MIFRTAVLLSTLVACALPATAAAAPNPLRHGLPGPAAKASAGKHLARPAVLPATASRSVVPETCPPEAEGAVCGHVDVPFDRKDPSAGTIPIVFELYPHSAPGPAESAIIVNLGGPGVSTTWLRGVPRFWFGPALEHHDLLLVDDRGRGRSGAIDCPDYQRGTAPTLLDAVAGCAAQLGAGATRYSTADIALDYEAVRAALGYEAVDFVGNSYGGVDAAAYATRFGKRLRSILLSGAWGEPAFDPFVRAADGTRVTVERVGLLCRRSRLCRRSAREAVADVGALARRVRRAPVRGTGLDADGQPHDVTVDARYLLLHILDTGGFFLTPAELPAAAAALKRGDATPLLRLAAEGDFAIPGDNGDPTEFSQGANSATFCLDQPWPWSPSASLATRQRQWARAVARAADAPFAPFSAEEIMHSVFGGADFCLPWPETSTRPPVERDARYPNVPTLVFNGELDLGAGLVPKTAGLYPGSKLVTFAGTGHTPLEWSQCAGELATGFLQGRKVGDTGCASRSLFDYPGVAAFPRRTSRSPAAAPAHRNRAGRRSRRVARVAADAALDALKRSFMSGGDGPGLRGGTFHTDYDQVWTTTLESVRWTEDIAVSGVLHWSFDGGALDADLVVVGPGGFDGTLHLEGGWLIPGAPRSIAINGTVGGKHIAATMPST